MENPKYRKPFENGYIMRFTCDYRLPWRRLGLNTTYLYPLMVLVENGQEGG
ncbi:hypothetical protein [Pacificibacter maritimus]|uniref:hypothetical protein n=1 Tax=Pacificibacter maritimus TaxID=762213 RepID=UPI00147459E4|nr:hypothetical protein [Pacificibacter maritimus]